MAKVLIVDDSEVDRRLVSKVLQQGGNYQTETATSGADALSKMAQSPPDVVLTDLIMPEMDGLELVSAIRRKHRLVPVILMTSAGAEDVAVKALRGGAAGFVHKVAIIRELVPTLNRVLTIAGQQRDSARLLERMVENRSRFVLENDRTLFPPLINYLQSRTMMMGLCDDTERIRLGVALEEALSNALEHGNLEIGEPMREMRAENPEGYLRVLQERAKEAPYRDRRIYVEANIVQHEAVFKVRDEGRGFDFSVLPDPDDPANIEHCAQHGLLLMRTFLDELRYTPPGNEVTLIKRRPATGAA
jgi:CheY-like chemotaxis protein